MHEHAVDRMPAMSSNEQPATLGLRDACCMGRMAGMRTMRLISLMAWPKVVAWKPVVYMDSRIPFKSQPLLKSHPLIAGVSGIVSVGTSTACKRMTAEFLAWRNELKADLWHLHCAHLLSRDVDVAIRGGHGCKCSQAHHHITWLSEEQRSATAAVQAQCTVMGCEM